MTAIYAVREDTGQRVLVEIQCDGCGATVKPHADIVDSGWTKRGFGQPGSYVVTYYCPDCACRC